MTKTPRQKFEVELNAWLGRYFNGEDDVPTYAEVATFARQYTLEEVQFMATVLERLVALDKGDFNTIVISTDSLLLKDIKDALEKFNQMKGEVGE